MLISGVREDSLRAPLQSNDLVSGLRLGVIQQMKNRRKLQGPSMLSQTTFCVNSVGFPVIHVLVIFKNAARFTGAHSSSTPSEMHNPK
jgi:hypothetical protein